MISRSQSLCSKAAHGADLLQRTMLLYDRNGLWPKLERAAPTWRHQRYHQ